MATQPHTAIVLLDDYLAAEDVAEVRSEYVDGEVVAMVGGSLEHGTIVHNLDGILYTQLRGGPCRTVSQGTHVRIERTDRVFYPDIAVYCGEPKREKRVRDLLLNPTVIMEVLSPSTEGYDRGRKWDSYRQIPTLQEYLLVSQEEPRVQHYIRHGEGLWLFSDALGLEMDVRLDSIGVRLLLAEVYEGVFTADDRSA
jgi:Uma2 family endonuclease